MLFILFFNIFLKLLALEFSLSCLQIADDLFFNNR